MSKDPPDSKSRIMVNDLAGNDEPDDSEPEKLSSIGERKAIDLITSILTPGSGEVAVGPGDDCAALRVGGDYILITTDMATQKTHFPPNITPYQIGWHIVAINLSDLAAKGAKPLGLVIAVGMPENYDVKFLENMFEGMNSCATSYGTFIIGGDIKAHDHLTLAGTAIGRVPQNEFMSRSGTKRGDLLGVTGTLGRAGTGFYNLKHKLVPKDKEVFIGLFEPKPKLAEGHALAKSNTVTSCMDISDGLAHSLFQLAKLNHVGFDIIFDDVPVAPEAKALAKQLNLPLEDLTIYFGGDYELLVTVKPDCWAEAKEAVRAAGSQLTQIGIVTDKPELNMIKDGIQQPLENRGYEHFKWKS
ncbi:thiamine-phosphate kinase [[Eubacterium] cellulosolvens]